MKHMAVVNHVVSFRRMRKHLPVTAEAQTMQSEFCWSAGICPSNGEIAERHSRWFRKSHRTGSLLTNNFKADTAAMKEMAQILCAD
jgi:hypothetical protein